MICENVRISIDGELSSYEFASFRILPSWMMIDRLDADDFRAGRSTISSRGPHFWISFPQALAWESFERVHSEFQFRGPKVGSMSEVSGAAAREGTYTHGIKLVDIAITVEPNIDRLSMKIFGELCPIRQAIEGWPCPKPRNNFAIEIVAPLSGAPDLFDSVSNPQERMEQMLRYHPDTQSSQSGH